ncbi:TPA: conjugal transfer protein TraL, partial [Legionella pneumophila]|nr:conjugal transfer protein TraL [Legionella pneumophila]HCX3404651.1 conjugal transfer protein TraL [Legionella pneumophila]
FGRDLTDMLQQKMTFNEAINCPERNIMTKQRLKLIRDQLFGQIDNAMVI